MIIDDQNLEAVYFHRIFRWHFRQMEMEKMDLDRLLHLGDLCYLGTSQHSQAICNYHGLHGLHDLHCLRVGWCSQGSFPAERPITISEWHSHRMSRRPQESRGWSHIHGGFDETSLGVPGWGEDGGVEVLGSVTVIEENRVALVLLDWGWPHWYKGSFMRLSPCFVREHPFACPRSHS